MTDAFASPKEKSPNATLLAVGPPAYAKQSEAKRLAARDAVEDAAVAGHVDLRDKMESLIKENLPQPAPVG